MPRSTAALVERQMVRWRIGTQAGAPPVARPCVTISRLPHSDAARLGLMLAERLGYGFFGIEILDTIAREHGIALRLLEGLDERVRSAIERRVADAMGHPGLTEDAYIHHVVRVVTTLGERGGCVLFGRGASFILSHERALRILITAPAETRAERLAKERDLELAEARVELGLEDVERERFLRHHFGRDPNDPAGYDLVLNTGTLSLDGAVALALGAFDQRFPGQRALATHS